MGFTAMVNWTVSGRNILPLLPAVALLLVRRLAFQNPLRKSVLDWRLATILGASLGIALMVTEADARLANSARSAAGVIKQKTGAQGGALWFEGHWGFQYYMERGGAKSIDRENPHLASNDAVVVPLVNSFLFDLPADQVTPDFKHDSPLPKWLATMSADAGAGYYSASWGPLPFVFSSVPPDRYLVFRVK